MAVLKIRKVTEEKEGYGSMLIRTAVVCAVLLSVCSAYFSVINLKLNMAAIVPAVVIPVFLAALFLSAKRGRKIKALLLLLAASAVFILGIRPSMNGMLPFWNGYVKLVNAYYRISWTLLSGEVDSMGSQMVIAAVSMALAVLLFLILSSRRAGSAAASVMVLPVVMAALVGIFPSWNCCWALLISGCFYRIIFQRGKPETLFRTCMCGAVVLAVLYGCGRMAAPKINSYRETHTESYKKIKNVLLDAQNMDMHEMPKTEKGANYAAGGIGKGDLDGLGEHRPQGRKDLEITVTEKPDRSIYLRAYTGTTYTGKGWKELSASAFSEVAPRVGGGEKKKELFELPFTQIAEDPQSPAPQTMKVELVGASKEFAYSPYYMQVPSGGKVILDSRLKGGKKSWEYLYYPKEAAEDFQGEADTGRLWATYQEFVKRAYVQVPEELERMKQLAESMNSVTQDALARSIERQFSGLRYSMTPGNCPKDMDFAEYFLFENRKGFCVHFATAATLLYRECGYPARYVEGYTISQSAFDEQADGTWRAVVTDEMAHAWCETFDSVLGWQVREYTPSYTSANNDVADKDAHDDGKDRGNTTPPSEKPSAGSADVKDHTETGGANIGGTAGGDSAPVGHGSSGERGLVGTGLFGSTGEKLSREAGMILRWLLLGTGTLALGLAMMILQQKIRRQRKMYRFRSRKENRGIASMYQAVYEMCAYMGRKGERSSAQTESTDMSGDERQILEQMKAGFPQISPEEWDWMYDCAQRAAFGGQSIPREEWKQMYRLYMVLRKTMISEMSRGKKFWFVYVRGY